MKRIALVVAVASLLTAPVVLAQSAPQSMVPPSAQTPEVPLKETGRRPVPSEDTLASPKEAQKDVPIGRTENAVSGSFEDPTVEGPLLKDASTVSGSFEDPTSGF